MFYDFFSRYGHKKVALELSFGKDSAACLWLTKQWWDQIVVIWCSPGRPVPAAVEYMAQVAKMVPNFVMLRGEQQTWVEERGHPTDALPFEATPLYRQSTGDHSNVRLSFVGDCCRENLWIPMHQYVMRHDFEAIIRGQRQADRLKSPVHSGEIHDGIEYFFPVENWSDQEVVDYLGDRIPAPYKEGVESSIDCANCTAYSSHRKGLQAYLDRHLPLVGEEVRLVRMETARLLKRHIVSLGSC